MGNGPFQLQTLFASDARKLAPNPTVIDTKTPFRLFDTKDRRLYDGFTALEGKKSGAQRHDHLARQSVLGRLELRRNRGSLACSPGEEPRGLGQVIAGRTDAWSVAFSPDSQRLAIGLADRNIHIWDIKHRMLVGVLKGHRQPVWELGFNPEDDSLVSLSPDELRVWRVADGD